MDSLSYTLSRFKYDLSEAPFNPKDKKLLPAIGACTGCKFNTASLKTLFPEFAKEAICTNKDCYQNKCDAHFIFLVATAFQKHKPNALLYYGLNPNAIDAIIRLVPGADELPKYDRHDVTIFEAPEKPEKEDFNNDEEVDEDEEPEFDEEGFAQAMQEYNTDLEAYNLAEQNGKILKGLFVSQSKIEILLFSPEASPNNSFKPAITAKEVQAAIQAGQATPELLIAEIDRINAREERAKEIDRDKMQDSVHKNFTASISEIKEGIAITDADMAAAKLLIFQSLGYTTRSKVSAVLFGESENSDTKGQENLFDILKNISDQQYAYLIRMAVVSKPECKFPKTDTGYFLYQMADAGGLNIAAIEEEQDNKARIRETKLKERIKDLENKISKFKTSD